MPERALTDASDLLLFQELGLKECNVLDACEKIVESLRLRQLDKLKIVLSRIAKEDSVFSPELKEGIRKNDLRAFARAILMLNG